MRKFKSFNHSTYVQESSKSVRSDLCENQQGCTIQSYSSQVGDDNRGSEDIVRFK